MDEPHRQDQPLGQALLRARVSWGPIANAPVVNNTSRHSPCPEYPTRKKARPSRFGPIQATTALVPIHCRIQDDQNTTQGPFPSSCGKPARAPWGVSIYLGAVIISLPRWSLGGAVKDFLIVKNAPADRPSAQAVFGGIGGQHRPPCSIQRVHRSSRFVTCIAASIRSISLTSAQSAVVFLDMGFPPLVQMRAPVIRRAPRNDQIRRFDFAQAKRRKRRRRGHERE